MPAIQTVNLNAPQRTEPTGLEKTLGAFANAAVNNQTQRMESDALSDVYKKYLNEGRDLEKAFFDVQQDPRISPTTRVNTINQLLKLQETNNHLQAEELKRLKGKEEADFKRKQAEDIANKRGLSQEEAAAYANNPALLERTTRPKAEPKINQADRPIDEDQQKRIDEVQSSPNWENATIPQKQQLLSRAGVSTSNQKPIMEALVEDQKIATEKRKADDQAVDSAYKAQEKFIDETTSKFKAFETDTKPKLMQMQKLASDEELIGPIGNAFLETLGMPLGSLDDPSSELYNKLSLDLLKGLPETYGNRILKVEVDNFLKTVPGLSNSPEGRRMIASNILKLGEMKEVYYNEMRKQQREFLDNNKPLPRDFQQKVFDQVKPQIDRINDEFVKLSSIKSVPKDTIPFFDPNGDIVFVPKEHAQWAQENKGRRIW